jgi:hypothetical protein
MPIDYFHSKDIIVYVVGEPVTGRFTPTQQQVDSVETRLPQLLRSLARLQRPSDADRSYKRHLRPITKNLATYQRQYIGFYNRKHQPCLYIHFFTSDIAFYSSEYFLQRLVEMSDAGFMTDSSPNLWHVNLDLTTTQLYRFSF